MQHFIINYLSRFCVLTGAGICVRTKFVTVAILSTAMWLSTEITLMKLRLKKIVGPLQWLLKVLKDDFRGYFTALVVLFKVSSSAPSLEADFILAHPLALSH